MSLTAISNVFQQMKCGPVAYALGTLLLIFSETALALPVEDFGEWVRTIQVTSQLKDQMTTLLQQYQTLQNQYTQMKAQYAASTGNYGWGNWNNSETILQQQRQWAAPDWASALKGMAGGNPARYQELLSEYQSAHASLSQNTYQQGTDSNLAASYQNEVQTNQASATTSTYEFNTINDHLQTLYQLGQQIEDTEKNGDLKAATDLNSRVQLEVAFLSVEAVRMQTVMNQQMAENSAARIAAENEAAQFNQAGDTP